MRTRTAAALLLAAALPLQGVDTARVAAAVVPAISRTSSNKTAGIAFGTIGSTTAPAVAKPLTYHNGPVQHSSAVYAFFWVPLSYKFPAGYTALVSRYFTDVAHDNFKTSNVYSVDTQYYDLTAGVKQFASYSVSYRKAIVDTHPFPASGCPNYLLADGATSTICLTNTQLRGELNSVIAADHLPKGLGTDYFIFSPAGVTSCAVATGLSSDCFDPIQHNGYCSYHTATDATPSAVLYADMPYVAPRSTCVSGEEPNANPADAVLDGVSGEQNSMITDPLGTGWYDSAGTEMQNKCNLAFGTPLGSTGSGMYNQLINGHPYWLKEAWSNRLNACVQRNTFPQPTASFTYTPLSPKHGATVKFSAVAHDTDDSTFAYRWTFPNGVTSSLADPVVTLEKTGTDAVTLIVYDVHGDQTEVVHAITVS
jgi:PKD domain